MRSEQRLNCDFDDFPRLAQTVLENAQSNPEAHDVCLYVSPNGRAVLEVHICNEMRNFLLLSFELVIAPKKLVEAGLLYRFEVARAKNKLLEERLLNVYQTVRQANPNLGQQVKKLVFNGY